MKQSVNKGPKVKKEIEEDGVRSTMGAGFLSPRHDPQLRNRDTFFDNLKGWMRPQEVAETFGISVLTIYSWKAKAKTRKIPEGLFIKFNRQLYVRTDVLRRWISLQNDHIEM